MARALIDRGFTRVRPLEGGLAAWVDAGLPTDEETLVTIGGVGLLDGSLPRPALAPEAEGGSLE